MLTYMAGLGLHIDFDEVRSDSLWTIYYCTDNTEANLNDLIL